MVPKFVFFESSNNKPFGMRLLKVAADGRSMELLAFLADGLKISRRRAKHLLDERRVYVNRRRVWMARHHLQPGDLVEVQSVAPEQPTFPPQLLFEDEDLVVVDKPAGLLAVGRESLESRMRAQRRYTALRAVHRLDADTSGCMILACNLQAAERLRTEFKRRRVTKRYRAIVIGRVRGLQRKLDWDLDGRSGTSYVKVIVRGEHASLVEVETHSGRLHQVRRHLALAGYPVAGDRVYATGSIALEALRALPRQMLHAEFIAFRHPTKGIPVECRAPLPTDFRSSLEVLGLSGLRKER